jgi:hypothetical protein
MLLAMLNFDLQFFLLRTAGLKRLHLSLLNDLYAQFYSTDS